MTTIRLYNTKSRKKEAFTPLDARNVRMYVCGPTVYDRAHLGNARPVMVFDVLYRLLRHEYGAKHVTYARNFTDVDDKINARAAESGRSIGDITDETIGWFLQDMGALGALAPDHAPRATAYIGEMVTMIEELITSGHAYQAAGHVLFDVHSYENYGSLSGRSIKDMIAGARVEIAPYKRDPMDFVLWKPSTEAQPGWPSPWGNGRPGWHIECSAMTRALFGGRFDIHGGGLDLAFPHHENEKAQSCCQAGEDAFAQVWMHNEMLQVEGKKMSKSLGNFFSVREQLDKGVPGEVIRFVMLSTHYRKPMDWTEKKAREAEATLRKWRSIIEGTETGIVDERVIAALADDLNTAQAITILHELALDQNGPALRASAEMLGLLTPEMGGWFEEIGPAIAAYTSLREILVARKTAKENKDFTKADLIRDLLADNGISVKDMPDGKIMPTIEYQYVLDFLHKLSTEEKANLFGDKFDPETGSIDGPASGDAYQLYVSKKILEALK